MESKIKALAEFLGIEADAIEKDEHVENRFYADGGEFLVLTDKEADKAAAEEIEFSLWAFNADFIIEKTGLSRKMSDYEAKSVIESLRKMQESTCESCNEFIKAVIAGTCGLENFTLAAINADGRAHFLATYDDKENESGDYYIYRTN